jgi:hypothetical protein
LEAIMTIDSRLHADHQLDQLAAQFEHWRQHRSHAHERIPTPLWDQAVALTETLAPSRVATHLRLGVADLKKQIALRHGDPAPATPVGFVEVPPPPASPHGRGGFEVELQRMDGARLRIHAPAAAALPLAAMVQSFLEARS